MKQVTLTEWYGRLGNNLTQLCNAIEYARQKKWIFVNKGVRFCGENPIRGVHDGLSWYEGEHHKKHAMIQDFLVNFSDLSGITLETVDTLVPEKVVREFYDERDLVPVSNATRSEILRTWVRPHFLQQSSSEIDDKTLVIHIRSGDIFNPGAHSFYVQPPFAFYKKVIEDFGFQKLHILTESDMRNPCIHLLQTEYPNVKIQASSLAEDVGVILQAQHFLCNSHGTFGHMLALLSDKLRHLYIPYYCDPYTASFQDNGFLSANQTHTFFDLRTISHFQVHEYVIDDYIAPFSWNPGNPAQYTKLVLLPTSSVRQLHVKNS
jgi:hypothetical protein